MDRFSSILICKHPYIFFWKGRFVTAPDIIHKVFSALELDLMLLEVIFAEFELRGWQLGGIYTYFSTLG